MNIDCLFLSHIGTNNDKKTYLFVLPNENASDKRLMHSTNKAAHRLAKDNIVE